MALAFRSASSNSASSGTDANVVAPSGMADGDWIVVIVEGNGQITISDDNGSTPFTKAPNFSDYKPNTTNGHTITVFYRRKQSGDPTTFHFALSVGGRWSVDAMAFSGDNVDFDVAPNTANAANEDSSSDGSIDIPSISVAANTIHVVFCGWDTSAIGTITTPSGYTLIANANGGGEPLHASRKAFASAGSTGAVTCSNTEFGAKIAGSFSVKEAASGGTATPIVATMTLSSIAATVIGGASIVAAIASAVFSIPTPTLSGGANIAPTVQSVVFSVQSPALIIGGANATPSVGEITVSVQASTPSGGGAVTPAVAEVTFSAPVAGASGGSSGNAEATPSVATFTVAIQSPTVSGGGKVEPGVAELTVGIQSPVVSGGASASPSAGNVSASVPTVGASGGGRAMPGATSLFVSGQNANASGGSKTDPMVVDVTVSSPIPSVSGGSSVLVLAAEMFVFAPEITVSSARVISKFSGIIHSIYPISGSIRLPSKNFLLNGRNTNITLKNNGRSGVIRGNNNQFTQKL